MDASDNYRYFLESFDDFSELRRGRLATMRARMNYVMSVGYDRETDSFYTVTVPNRRHPALVISRFGRGDLTLSEEYHPRVGPGLDLAGGERSLDEYYVTGVVIDGGRLYAVSAAFRHAAGLRPATPRADGSVRARRPGATDGPGAPQRRAVHRQRRRRRAGRREACVVAPGAPPAGQFEW